MSLAFLLFCGVPVLMCIIGFWASIFEIREYAVHQGLRPAHGITILGPALRDRSHPARGMAIQFTASLVGAILFSLLGLTMSAYTPTSPANSSAQSIQAQSSSER